MSRFTFSYENASALEIRLPTPTCVVYSIGSQLRPVNLQGSRPQRVSCYALFKGWLLLSQPPRCLRQLTLFTLSHLVGIRDLNYSLGCSPFGSQASPKPPRFLKSTRLKHSELDRRPIPFET